MRRGDFLGSSIGGTFESEEKKALGRASEEAMSWAFGVGLVRLSDGLVNVGHGWQPVEEAEKWLSTPEEK